jgi:chromosome segregation ATPase
MERLRSWLGSETERHCAALENIQLPIAHLRAANRSAAASVRSRAVTYTAALTALLENAASRSSRINLEKTRAAARTVTNALLTLADNQTQLSSHLAELQTQLEEMEAELQGLHTETLRELTRLRASVRGATWSAPPTSPRIGTYLDSRPN